MSTRPPEPVKAAPRRRLRKALIFAFLGVLLGVLVVFFLARVYNPFEEGIGDRQLLVLAPADADMLVFIPRVPKFLGELRDRPFSKALADNPRFQQFLRSDWARKTGAVEALSSAFRELDLLRSRPPLGLDLWKDISGEALLFAGYGPSAPGEPWQFVAMFRPNSWKVARGGQPPRRRLARRPSARPHGARGGRRQEGRALPGFRHAHVRARTGRLVRPDQERRRRRNRGEPGDAAQDRDRSRPHPARARSRGTPTSLRRSWHRRTRSRAVVRRKIADEQLNLTQTLDREWGAENVSLLESALPRFGGEDLLLTLAMDETLELKVRMTEASPRPNDIAKSFKPFDREEAGSEFLRAAPLLPETAFAFAHLKVDVPRFLDAFFQRPELFTAADLGNLADALRSVPELGDLAGLKEKLARICDGSLSLGFFKQDRDGLDKPTPGYFVAWHLQDEKELKRILDAIGARIRERAPDGPRAIRDLVRVPKPEVDYYEIVVPQGVVDDPRVTKLGLVVGKETLIVTNFIPSFKPLTEVGLHLGSHDPGREDARLRARSGARHHAARLRDFGRGDLQVVRPGRAGLGRPEDDAERQDRLRVARRGRGAGPRQRPQGWDARVPEVRRRRLPAQARGAREDQASAAPRRDQPLPRRTSAGWCGRSGSSSARRTGWSWACGWSWRGAAE